VTNWIPVNDPLPPDDTHTWARPASEPCPDCDCCSKALCELAVEKAAANEFDGACHFLGTSADFDLAQCPCWRNLPGHTPSKYPRGKRIR
jgi:hypothetical protein